MRSSKSRQKQNLHVNSQNPWGSNPLPRTKMKTRMNAGKSGVHAGFLIF